MLINSFLHHWTLVSTPIRTVSGSAEVSSLPPFFLPPSVLLFLLSLLPDMYYYIYLVPGIVLGPEDWKVLKTQSLPLKFAVPQEGSSKLQLRGVSAMTRKKQNAVSLCKKEAERVLQKNSQEEFERPLSKQNNIWHVLSRGHQTIKAKKKSEWETLKVCSLFTVAGQTRQKEMK